MRLKSIHISKVIKRTIIVLSVLIILFVLVSNMIVVFSKSQFIFSDLRSLPHNKTGLVLGTSKYYRNGKTNDFFINRIRSAVLLYRAKKIDYIIVSGDNRTMQYNEPLQMKKELMKYDIPANRIILDFAGLRTLDSVLRCREIFGQDSFTIISQRFHNKRAVFIARQNGINAVGFNADDVKRFLGLRTHLREILARVNVILDVFIFHKKPHFLGEKIRIEA